MYGSFAPLARGLGRFEVRAVFRRPPKLNAREAMGLRHGDAKEPVPAAIPVHIVDARAGVTLIKRKFDLTFAGHSVGLFPQLGMLPEALHRAIECYGSPVRQWLEKHCPTVKAMAKIQGGFREKGSLLNARPTK